MTPSTRNAHILRLAKRVVLQQEATVRRPNVPGRALRLLRNAGLVERRTHKPTRDGISLVVGPLVDWLEARPHLAEAAGILDV